MRDRIFAVALALLFWAAIASAALAEDCSGSVAAKWNPDGRTITLTENYTYIDPTGVSWLAPKGWVVDGASIPQWAWSVIGGPFEGKYRDASVVHDVACD